MKNINSIVIIDAVDLGVNCFFEFIYTLKFEILLLTMICTITDVAVSYNCNITAVHWHRSSRMVLFPFTRVFFLHLSNVPSRQRENSEGVLTPQRQSSSSSFTTFQDNFKQTDSEAINHQPQRTRTHASSRTPPDLTGCLPSIETSADSRQEDKGNFKAAHTQAHAHISTVQTCLISLLESTSDRLWANNYFFSLSYQELLLMLA